METMKNTKLMGKEWMGQYTDPVTKLKVIMVKDNDGQIRSYVNLTSFIRGVK